MNKTKEKLWSSQYILTITLTFLFFLGMQSLLGGFPVYITKITSNPTNGGLMTTAFMMAAVFSRPFVGILLEKISMKKLLWITIITAFIAISCCFFTTSIWFFLILRVIQGISFGFASTIFATFTTNNIPQARLGEGIGFFGMATSIGTTLGPMIAINILNSFPFKLLLTFSISIMVMIFIASFWIAQKRPSPSKNRDKEKLSIINSAFDKRAFIPCFLVMVFYLTFAGIVNFLDGLGKTVGIGPKSSLFFGVLVIMLVLTRPFSGRIYDSKGHQYLLYPSAIFCIIGLVLLANMKSVSGLIIAAVFYGVAYGVMQPTFQAWAVSQVDINKQATANAMALSFMDLGQALGAVMLGVVAGQMGYSDMYYVTAFLAVCILLIYSFTEMRKKRIILHS
ncbi:MFS transporter [Rummeliibacillus sp. JY-2-4R]